MTIVASIAGSIGTPDGQSGGLPLCGGNAPVTPLTFALLGATPCGATTPGALGAGGAQGVCESCEVILALAGCAALEKAGITDNPLLLAIGCGTAAAPECTTPPHGGWLGPGVVPAPGCVGPRSRDSETRSIRSAMGATLNAGSMGNNFSK